ncbi:MAG TPA: glycosyltransferase family 39 protein [Candidatus Udaeobacter sp.]|jgi:hypothetical protein|nr:glycosyltransferase family 39 protein [Candidatus Udaeobacter sp.]
MTTSPGRLPKWIMGQRLELLAVVALLALAAALRLAEATRVPMWFDEIYTLRTARFGPAGILHALRADVHPPLHELIVWMWWRLVGDSELRLRALSVIFGVATVGVVYAATRDFFGRAAALLAALLLTLHRVHVYHSQELRAYAMLWLLYYLAAWAAWRFVRDGRRGAAVGYVLAGAAALYTHYQAILFLALTALWGAIALLVPPRDAAGPDPHGPRGRRLITWAGLHLAIAALFLPQVPTLLIQIRRNQESHWIQPPHFDNITHLLQSYAFGYKVLMLPALALVVLPLFLRPERRAASLLWTCTLPVIVFSYITTQHGAHLFTERYMQFVLPAWCILLAAGIIGIRWQWFAAVLGIGFAALAARSLTLHQPFEESRELALADQYVAARARPGDIILTADTHSLLFFVEHEPRLARYRLLLVGGPLPYYEGTAVIPDSLVWKNDDFVRWRAAGGRWYGVRTHHGGVDSRPALDSLRAHAAAIRHLGPLVIVVEGQTDTIAAPR